jgi:hypothetical protein
MEAHRSEQVVGKDGEIVGAGLPLRRGQPVEVIVFPHSPNQRRPRRLTAGRLRKSGLISLWRDRDDIADGARN